MRWIIYPMLLYGPAFVRDRAQIRLVLLVRLVASGPFNAMVLSRVPMGR